MVIEITLRAASAADQPFLLQLGKLTMTKHLLKAGVATDDDSL
ncbi:hypothetical protein [Trinickia sp. Y13]|nr:hypothetical protein [Trinickia sp. Y13]